MNNITTSYTVQKNTILLCASFDDDYADDGNDDNNNVNKQKGI